MPGRSSSSGGQRARSQHQIAEWRRLLNVEQPAAEELQDRQKRRDDLVDAAARDGTEGHARGGAQRVENAGSTLVYARASDAGQLDLRLARFERKASPDSQ